MVRERSESGLFSAGLSYPWGRASFRGAEGRLLKVHLEGAEDQMEPDCGRLPEWWEPFALEWDAFWQGLRWNLQPPLAVSPKTAFAARVIAKVRSIPPGETRSYSAVAGACGSPGAARAVGGMMAHNSFPIIIPCHRVVGKSGQLTGFSAGAGVSLKRALLDWEAAAFLTAPR